MATTNASSAVLGLPDGWQPEPDIPEGIELIALESPHGGFRANVVVTETEVPNSFAEWQGLTDDVLAANLSGYVLIDLEYVAIAGEPGGRRLAAYVGPQDDPLVVEQWFVLIDGTGYTLTFTTDTWRYPETADEFWASAQSWIPVIDNEDFDS